MDFKKLLNAWRFAANDLDLTIKSPIVLTSSCNEEIRFKLLVEDFGSKKGTIIITTEEMRHFDIPKQNGYYCSALNLETYKTYNRQHFIDTLNDWGYFGDISKKPDWYTGQTWT